MRHRVLSGILVLLFSGGMPCAASPRFEPPAPRFAGADALGPIVDDLENGRLAGAVTRIDTLLHEHAASLVAIDPDTAVSVDTWLARVTRSHVRGLSEEFSRQLDPAARAALDGVRRDPGARPDQFYGVARRYPFSSVAATALAAAASRAAEWGDFAGASACFNLAVARGWRPDAATAQVMAVCRVMNQESPGDLPAEAQLRAAQVAQRLAGYRGPVLIDGIWYNRTEHVHAARYLPIVADRVFYVAGARNLLAVREDGTLLWRQAAGETWSKSSPDRAPGRGRGPVFSPVVFSASAGTQIVVARQQMSVGRDACLRAYRAVDGKLLWSSEGLPAYDRLGIVSAPALSGRYLYAVGVEYSPASGSLQLLAIDLLNGEVLFKTPLGTMLELRGRRQDPPGWDDFFDQGEPAVAGDAVYLSPNVGVAFCVGRFDGQLRWYRIYEDSPEQAVWRDRTNRAPPVESPASLPPPADPDRLLRWRNTPAVAGDRVVFAPQDTAAVIALDSEGGGQRWTLAAGPAPTLVSATTTTAVFAGAVLAGIDVQTGKTRWTWQATSPTRIAGPPVPAGGALAVPTTDGRTVLLHPDTGKPATIKLMPPTYRKLLSMPATRDVLEQIGVLRTFGLPGAAPRVDRPQ